MKYIELKDLRPGQELILAWKDDYLNQYYPFKVKVEKGKKIVFEDLDEPDEIISYVEFHHAIKGFDIDKIMTACLKSDIYYFIGLFFILFI